VPQDTVLNIRDGPCTIRQSANDIFSFTYFSLRTSIELMRTSLEGRTILHLMIERYRSLRHAAEKAGVQPTPT
jgi:hypothetical protein